MEKIKDGGQQVRVEICLLALGKEGVQQEVLAGHEPHSRWVENKLRLPACMSETEKSGRWNRRA